MNKQTLTVNSQRIIFSLLAIATVGLTPISAKADTAVIQESTQESYTTGEGNVSVQNSSQVNRQSTYHRGRYGYYTDKDDSTGIVQRSSQYCDQYGESNVCVQNGEQRNTTRTYRRRRF